MDNKNQAAELKTEAENREMQLAQKTLQEADQGAEAADRAKEESLSPQLSQIYEFVGVLGSGGMGEVFKAKHKILKQFVAIKRIKADKVDQAAVKRFVNEAKAASLLKHANLAGVREFGVDAETGCYAIMDFVEGISLSSMIESGLLQNDPLRLIKITEQLAEGLQFAHEHHVVHRDIKPSNIIVNTDAAGKDQAVIVDFGIAKLMHSNAEKLTQTGEVYGSPAYMSPEQALGKEIDYRTDIYSLGCVLFECLAGSPPYSGENPMQIAMKHINEPTPEIESECKDQRIIALKNVVSKCLEKETNNRYGTANDLIADLKKISKGEKLDRLLNRQQSRINSGSKHKLRLTIFGLICLFVLVLQYSLEKQKESAAYQRFSVLPISEDTKQALVEDDLESYDFFGKGKYRESAYRLETSNLVMDKEIARLEMKTRSSLNQHEIKTLRQTIWQLQFLKVENLVHMARCQIKLEQFDDARNAIEKAIAFIRSERKAIISQDRSFVFDDAYKSYLEILRAQGLKEKQTELEKEYASIKEQLTRARSNVLP